MYQQFISLICSQTIQRLLCTTNWLLVDLLTEIVSARFMRIFAGNTDLQAKVQLGETGLSNLGIGLRYHAITLFPATAGRYDICATYPHKRMRLG